MRTWMLPVLALTLTGCELIEELGGSLEDPTNTTAVFGIVTSLDGQAQSAISLANLEAIPLPGTVDGGVSSVMHVARLEDGLVQEQPDEEDLTTAGSLQLQGCEPTHAGGEEVPENLDYGTEDGNRFTLATEFQVSCGSTELTAVYTPPAGDSSGEGDAEDGEAEPMVAELPMSLPTDFAPELPTEINVDEPTVIDLTTAGAAADITHVVAIVAEREPPVEDPEPADHILWTSEPQTPTEWLDFLQGEQDTSQITIDWSEVERADGSPPQTAGSAMLLVVGLNRTDNSEIVGANTAFSVLAGGHTVGTLAFLSSGD